MWLVGYIASFSRQATNGYTYRNTTYSTTERRLHGLLQLSARLFGWRLKLNILSLVVFYFRLHSPFMQREKLYIRISHLVRTKLSYECSYHHEMLLVIQTNRSMGRVRPSLLLLLLLLLLRWQWWCRAITSGICQKQKSLLLHIFIHSFIRLSVRSFVPTFMAGFCCCYGYSSCCYY